MKKKKIIAILFCMVAFATMSLGSVTVTSNEESSTQTEDTKEDSSGEDIDSKDKKKEEKEEIEEIVFCDVRDLMDTLDANPLKAASTYEGKTLSVTGYLSNVDASGKYFTLNAGENDFSLISIQFFIKNDEQKNAIIEFSQGDLLTVTGKCTSVGEILGYSIDTISIEEGDESFTSSNNSGDDTDDNDEGKSNGTIGQKNALAAAKSYVDMMSFSEKGIKDQLEFEGYESDEISYALENLDVDWNAEAAESAASYVDMMSFSKKELLDQLIFDGFTQEQAEYGVSSVGY